VAGTRIKNGGHVLRLYSGKQEEAGMAKEKLDGQPLVVAYQMLSVRPLSLPICTA